MCFDWFFVTIEAVAVPVMDLPRKLSTLSFRSNPGASEPSPRRRLPRILVVDDNPNTMSLMQDLLSSRGYDVVAVPDALQAEGEILRHAPDLILSDVVMPGKSGYELCRSEERRVGKECR